MNAPKELSPDQITALPLDQLRASPTNPRKRFDQDKLRELAESIKSIGIAQPILVRKVDAKQLAASKAKHVTWPFPTQGIKEEVTGTVYEIVAGERRFRAARIAELAQVPCYIRDLTDQQVLHLQIVENLQRDNLHPLEEAEGYQRLMEQKDAGGKKYTADAIAAEIGKSRSYIFQRMKLLDLCPDAREAFYASKIDASVALLIARIPVDKLQVKALKDVSGAEMSVRRARDFIRASFTLDLAGTAFDVGDADLLAKAGACTGCTKRTGNQPELFGDIDGKDICTDPVCFGMKKAAYVLKLQKEAEQHGHKFIGKDESKQIVPYPQFPSGYLHTAGLAQLSDKIEGDPEGRTWGQALSEKKLLEPPKPGATPAVQKTIIEKCDNSKEALQTINIEQATKALREAGFEITMKGSSSRQPTRESTAERLERERLEAQVKIEIDYRTQLTTDIHNKIAAEIAPGPSAFVQPGLYLMLAEDALDSVYGGYVFDHIIKLHAPELLKIKDDEEREEAFLKKLSELPTQSHFLILFDLLMMQDHHVGTYTIRQGSQPEILLRLAEIEGIDAAAIRKQAEDRAAPEKEKKPAKRAKEATPKAKNPPSEKSATPKPAARAQGNKPAKKSAAQAPEQGAEA